jgi:hypothetical protein
MNSLQDAEDKARRVGKLEHDCKTLGDELKRKSKQLQDLERHLEQVRQLKTIWMLLFTFPYILSAPSNTHNCPWCKSVLIHGWTFHHS